MAATLGQEALGAYVISMATSPSDVLAVKLMQVSFIFAFPFLSFPFNAIWEGKREAGIKREREKERYTERD